MPVNVGFVVIGRNEGARLRKCLEIVVGHAGTVVYVDSGSTDGSVDMARAMGVKVVELDMRVPFTAGPDELVRAVGILADAWPRVRNGAPVAMTEQLDSVV